MNHAPTERQRLLAKRYHRTKRGTLFERGIVIRHSYDGGVQQLTWRDDASFLLNDYCVALSWLHPRMAYKSLAEESADERLAHLRPDRWFGESKPVYQKAGRSRKTIRAYELVLSVQNKQFEQYQIERTRLIQAADCQVTSYLKAQWSPYARRVSLCVPIEVRDESDLRYVVLLARRLLKRETTLALEYPGYVYTRADWVREGFGSDGHQVG